MLRAVRRVGLLLIVAVLAAAVAAVYASPGTARVTGTCSRATAKRLIGTLPIAHRVLPFYGDLAQVVCVDFDLDGSADIVIGMSIAMNHGSHYWAAFRTVGGHRWVREAFRGDCCGRTRPHGGVGIIIEQRGHRFAVSQPIYRPTDPLCCPTGGFRSSIWGWRNGRLKIVG